ncbi:phosphate signaling complex protein PhoU [Staphylococcus intermedius]|uniref:Phosphate-specific transport system accessory protein PhoU n=1 Tax=Staphylococcus intermedius NCTC 11048 TaxID=1141106 RepID=A0A380G8Q9_STAIN|nr:phosphate signaling complex protein PhoU [Staphylococcus intermedius]PCF64816.1 phosphate transport system regulatory protein PhoU [Staphylococcus intermedius]PCF80426.1 phosphate transport system regulatory protein PhoU [Staphylococcus intermedius]PCF81776.1 phosphate transport system regulatory protein PhoU [Staphylococcus intermedius]PCF88113.1 phosphate transport system regulatory protein PhoU [Staphylococcus intermedius]PCF88827.1 phosphate transport system regulatory protein PhoU [Sta
MTVIRKRYEGQLNELLKDLRVLGLHTYSTIQKSIKVLSDENITHARQIVKNDRTINQMEYDINEKVVMLITRQQPIAKDLRMMIATLKIASEFERIADNAANIAKIRTRVQITDRYIMTRLETMGALALLMLKDLYDATRNKDLELVKEIIERDIDIDDLYKQIINTSYLIDNDPFVAGQAHLVARYLERIGDHVVNIAEQLYYFITGDRYESYTK